MAFQFRIDPVELTFILDVNEFNHVTEDLDISHVFEIYVPYFRIQIKLDFFEIRM